MQRQMRLFVEEVFGLRGEREDGGGKLEGVLQLLIDIRKEAKNKKDFVTSDKIRNELAALGVQLKDEKDGGMSYTATQKMIEHPTCCPDGASVLYLRFVATKLLPRCGMHISQLTYLITNY
jgi:hypothetical protein